MKKVLFRTIVSLGVIAVLLSSIAINANPVFVGNGPTLRKAATDATFLPKPKQLFTYEPRKPEAARSTSRSIPLPGVSSPVAPFAADGTDLSTCNQGYRLFTYNPSKPIQLFEVPAGVTSIEVHIVGANGGNSISNGMPGGIGYAYRATYTVTSADKLYIMPGQRGSDENQDDFTFSQSGGGGGGTFVSLNDGGAFADTTKLVAAAGGGGGASGSPSSESSGSLHYDINGSSLRSGNYGYLAVGGGAFGTDADGGTSSDYAGAGAGLLGDGKAGPSGAAGLAKASGWYGGSNPNGSTPLTEYGGYGGGGAQVTGGGGGGGFSGGGGGDNGYYGGGGGSYISPLNRTGYTGYYGDPSQGLQSGDGLVEIKWVIPKPIIAVAGNSQPIANGQTTVSVSDLTDFGSQSLNSTTTHTFQIRNTGTTALNISGITLNNTEFNVTQAVSATVAANGSTTFTASFTPVTTGAKTATISISNDDACVPIYKFNVAGKGMTGCSTPATPAVTVIDNCNGTSTLSTTATGTLLWSTGATTSSITVNAAGIYTVTQTVGTCTSAAGSGTAAPKTTPATPVVSVTDNCNGTSTLSTTASGALLWSNNATTSSITVSTAGTYSVTATVNGCTSAAGSGVAVPKTTPATPVVTVVDNCNGTSTLSTTATGTLLWSTNATTSTITVSTAGTYSVTATVNGCTSAAGSGVAAPKTTPATPVVTVVDNCNGTSTLSTTATGTLLWSTNATTSTITVSTAGTYSVTATVNGCTSAAGSGVAAPKTTPAIPVVTVVDNCGSSTLSTNASGSLLWSTGATTSSITVSNAGTYSVTTTVNGCTSAAGSATASPKAIPSAPVVSVVDNCGSSTLSTNASGSLLWSTGATTSSITVSNAGTYSVTTTVNGCTSAAGSATASPKVIPSAPVVSVVDNCGSSTLSTNASGSLLWSTGATTSSITVSNAGTYSVTTTVNGCTSAAGSATASPKAIPSAPVVSVVDNCGSSTLSTNASGSLLWSTGATTSSITVSNAGTYSVTTTVNGCTSAAGSATAAPKAIPSAPVVSVVDNCGSSTLSTNATGSLLWSTGETTSSISVTNAGSYSVTAAINGCTSVAGSATAAPKAIPSAPVVSVVDNCGSSTLSTNATGSLLWSTGATTSSITVTNAGSYSVTSTINGCTSAAGLATAAPKAIPSAPVVSVVDNCGSSTLSTNASGSLLWSTGETTSSITVTNAGSYSVTTTVNGCTSAAGSGVAAPKAIPSAPVVNVVDNCGSSTLSTNASGSLLWNTGATTSSITVTNAGSYSVTTTVNGCTSAAGSATAAPKAIPSAPVVSVADNCGSSTLSTNASGSLLWSTGATTSSITVSNAGTYSVTTTVNGCTSAAGSATASPKAIPAAPIVSVVDNCGSSTLSTNASGSLLWSTGATTSSITVSNAGTYSVTTTVNGCTSAAGSATASPKAIPSAPVVSVVDNCGSSTLSTNASGSLLWSTGETTSSITVTNAGSYSVTSTINGCASAAGSATASPKAIPSAPVVSVVDNCGSSILSTNASGSLLWSTGAMTSSITVSNAGTYSVTTTVNGCTSAAGSATASPKAIPSAPVVSVVDNCGSSTLSTNASGSLLWSTGATTSSITVTNAGSYSVTSTINGCTSAAGSATAAPKAIPSAPVVSVVDNCGSSTLSTNASGSLLWSTGETTSSITVTNAGSYSVTSTINGCTSAAGSATAAPKAIPSAPVVSVVDNCGSSTLSTNASGSLLWSTGATTSSITVSNAGTYSVTTTVNGCTSAAGSATASPKAIPSAPVVSVVDNCGSSTLSTNASGSLLWSTGETTSSISVTNAGSYSVTSTINGCTSAAGSATASPKAIPSAPVVSVVDNCGSSTLSTNASGSLLWSTGETTSSITVTNAGSYSVTSTINGCTSAAGSGVAAPKAVPVVDPIGGATSVCARSVTALSDNTPGGTWATASNNITIDANGLVTGVNESTHNHTGEVVSYTVTNAAGCSTTVLTSITVLAITPLGPITGPASVCAGNTIQLSNSTPGGVWSAGSQLTVDANGVVTGITTTESHHDHGTGDVVSYTVTNASGCTTVVNTTVTVLANPEVAPISGPSSVCMGSTIRLSDNTPGGIWSASANGDITVDADGTVHPVNVTTHHHDANIVSYTVTNAAGCSTTVSYTIEVTATPAVPVVTADGPTTVCPGKTVVLTSSAATGNVWSNGATTQSITVSATGTYSVVVTENGCSSAASNAVTVNIQDTTPPATPALPDITAECSATAATPTTTDDCAGTITGTTTDAVTYSTQGDHIIHWTFTDPSGNATTAIQHVIIRDVTAPVVNCPSNITAHASITSGGYGSLVGFTATASDNCTVPTISYDHQPNSFFPVGTTTVNVTADDGNGHTASCHFDVTVLAPEINIKGNNTDIVDGDNTPAANDHTNFGSTLPGVPVTETYTIENLGTDVLNVSSITIGGADAGSFTVSGFTPANIPVGGSVTFNVTFQSSAIGVANATVIVNNNDYDEAVYDFAISANVSCITPSFVTCHSDINTHTDPGVCTAVINYSVSATGVPLPALTYTFTGATTGNGAGDGGGSTFNKGVTHVVVTATNSCGAANCSFDVTVVDNENPTIINTPADISVPNNAGQCGAIVSWALPTASDNCPGVILTSDHHAGEQFAVGTTVVTYTATDAAGHTVTTHFNVTVTDEENPVIVTPNDITHTADAGRCSYTFASVENANNATPNGGPSTPSGSSVLTTASATDNCGMVTVAGVRSDNQSLDAAYPVGTTTITWTATDSHGHTATGIQTIIITDDEAPVIHNVPANITQASDANSCGAQVTWTAPTATDNCAAILSSNHQPGDMFVIGTTTVTYTATDPHGHTTTGSFDVTVKDEQAPTINCIADITVDGEANQNGAHVGYTVTATDNCGTPVVTYSITPGTLFPIGSTPVTATATDAAGHTTSCTFHVIVRNNPPVAVDDVNSTPEDTPVSGNVLPNDHDVDGHALVVTGFFVNNTSYAPGATASFTEGTIVLNANGSYTYTPAPNYNGSVPVVTYAITDGHGGSAQATLTINVTPVNDVPVAKNDAVSTNEDTPVSATVAGNDEPSGDGGNTWSVVTTTTHGTLTFNNDGSYTYVPNANYNGPDVFTYKVCDADGDCSTATVNITVIPVNDVPVAKNDAVSTNEDTPVSATVAGNDQPSGDGGNTWSVVTTTIHGTLTFNNDGSYTYVPNANYNGPDAFTYKLCDADGDCSTATVNITVIPVNDVPVAKNDAISTNEDTPVSATVAGNDEPSGDGGNTWSVVTTTIHGTLTFNNDGSYTYVPNANYNGPDAFTYKVCDVDGDCSHCNG